MASLIKSSVSAEEYNKIPLYSAVASLNETSELQRQVHHLISIGDIFIRYNVQDDWGVHLLHRHFAIPTSTVVVYDVVDPELDLCTFVPKAELGDARPRAYLLNKVNQFQAYEFETGPGRQATDPPAAFLSELASFLREKGLERVVALSKESTDEYCKTREEYLFNGQSTVSLRYVNVDEPAVISTRKDSQYMGHSGWSFARGVPADPQDAARNLLETSTATDGTPFSIYTIASHTHKEMTVGEDGFSSEKEIVLADDSVACTHEHVRKIIVGM